MINFKVDSSEVKTDLRRRIKKTENTQNLMSAVAGDLENAVQLNFKAQGRQPRWQRLKDATLKARARKGKSGRILQVSGRLKNSWVSKFGKLIASYGTKLKYAAIHNFGGTINQGARSELFQRKRRKRGARKGSFIKGKGAAGRGMTFKARQIKIPKREMAKLTRRDERNINKRIERYFA